MKVLTYTRIIINKQDEENIPTMRERNKSN